MPCQQGPIRAMSAACGAKQLHSLMGRSCQKHMYLQTGRHPAKLQPRMVAKCSLAGRPQRWILSWCWSPDWHHLSQEQSSAATGRQMTLRGLSHRQGQTGPSLYSQGPLPLSFPAGRPEAELGPREIFRPPLRLLLPPSLQMSSPASFAGRRGQGKGQDLKHPQPTSPDTPYTRITSGSATCSMTEQLTSSPLCFSFHDCKMG